MIEDVKTIAKVFNSTFQLLNLIDPSFEEDFYLHISKEDRKLMKGLYTIYNMKRYTKSYGTFEAIVLKNSVTTNQIPVVAAFEMCKISNKE